MESAEFMLRSPSAPETFIIDSQGVIRHKFVGVIDETVWREQLAGKYQALVDEAQP